MPSRRRLSDNEKAVLVDAIINSDFTIDELSEVVRKNLSENSEKALSEPVKNRIDSVLKDAKGTLKFKRRSRGRITLDTPVLNTDPSNRKNNLIDQSKYFSVSILNSISHFTQRLLQILDKLDINKELNDEIDVLKRQYLKDLAGEVFSKASLVFDSPDQFDAFIKELAERHRPKGVAKPDLPTLAPKLYKERENRNQKPEEFLEDVYGPWLRGKGLFRSHIKAWDLSLYQSLYKRRSQIPEFETLLPTAQGRSVDDLARSDSELVAARRASARKSQAKAKSNKP